MILKDLIIQGLTAFDIPCAPADVEDIVYFVGELVRWNDHINLVGFKNVAPVVTELLYDAFFLYGYAGDSVRIVDMGSGSGILAVPLAILCREKNVYSIDASLKKIQFQRHIGRELSLKGLTPIHERIENLKPLDADCLVVKAFGPITQILARGGPHLKNNARVLILKGRKEEETKVSGFELEKLVPYSLPGVRKRYKLFIYRKNTC